VPGPDQVPCRPSTEQEPVALISQFDARARSRRHCRAWLAIVLGLAVAGPAGLVPDPALALTPPPATAEDPPRAHPLPGPGEGAAPAAEPDEREEVGPPEEATAPAGLPSIHYRHAQEHAGERIEFEPGERVTVPFRPRADDALKVDGEAPRALPAGHATGRRMLESAPGSVWADGLPRDLARPGHFLDGRDARDDLGSPVRLHAADETAAGGITLASAALDETLDRVESAARVGHGLRREVFGFLPWWELADDRNVLDWETLSTVAYFSVGCEASGALEKRSADGSATTGWAGWTSSRMTRLIEEAHRNRTRVVLTVSCFAWSSGGAATQASVLRSATNRSRLARQVAAAVRDRGADGVNLDFEPLVAGYADEFTALVRTVRRELNAIAPGYQLTFDTLGSIGNQPIAAATAPGGADAVFIMGYDYRTAGSAYAGSISPLNGPIYDLTDTVRAYTARIPPSKVILGVPYYGRAWSTATSSLHGRTLSTAKYGGSAEPTYAQAVQLVAANGRRYDSVEEAPWTAYRKKTCTAAYGCLTSWRQLYYDDAASLRLRYDLVNRANLRGAGIWALGYDDHRRELRKAISDKLGADRTAPLVGVTTLAQQQRNEGFRVGWSSYDDSPVSRHDIQVSADGGSWSTWLAGTTQTSAIFLGTHGRTYTFRARATDVHGNVSAWRSIALGRLGVPGGITVGAFATVVTDGLRMRSSPSTGAAVMHTFAGGHALYVTGGPVTAQGYTWYRVAGPIRQWGPVDRVQSGGWVAASGNGARNLVPRRPVYATRVEAGMTGLRLANGGARVLTPNGDGREDMLPITWTNRRSFDHVTLRVYRANGRLAGTDRLGRGKARAGPQSYRWDGRLGGNRVPAGTYVIQLQGDAGSATFSAPSASPVNSAQLARFGVIVGSTMPTSVVSFTSSPASATRSRTSTWTMKFGGAVSDLLRGDIVRGGSATGCRLGLPRGAGTTWQVTVSECSTGTVNLTLKAGTVMDAVSNRGPSTKATAPTLVIDRTAPRSSAPKASLRSGVALGSTGGGTTILAQLSWSARDRGGAGVASYDVARSVDGRPFGMIATGVAASSLAVSLPPGHQYRFRVRARDRAGNVGAWMAGPSLRPVLLQQTHATISYRGAWRLGTNDRYSGSTDTFSTSAGATAKMAFTGRSIAWVTTLGPDRGAVRVFLDGRHVATVDTRAPGVRFRHVAWSRTWATSGTHTLKLVVVGTAGRPRADIDALEVIR
jgi:spore germination protein YaaH